MKMTKLYIVWQDPSARSWHPVGRLSQKDDVYKFVYTEGANKSEQFPKFGRMQDLYREYESNEIFPIFGNRLLPKSRPEYKDYIDWLGASDDGLDPLEQLARTGGIKKTDSLMIYPCPEKTSDGYYETYFFVHGISHLKPEDIHCAESLSIGEKLYPLFDIQNPYDQDAVSIRSDDPISFLGYVPRYIAKDVKELIELNKQDAELTVVRVNSNAPLQMKVLCRFRTKWHEDFNPCSHSEFKPISNS